MHNFLKEKKLGELCRTDGTHPFLNYDIHMTSSPYFIRQKKTSACPNLLEKWTNFSFNS